MNALLWRPRNSPISISIRDMSLNAWSQHWGSSMVDTRILFNSIKPLSSRIFWTTIIYNVTLHRTEIPLSHDIVAELYIDLKMTFLPNFERFSLNICKDCDMSTENTYSKWHPLPSHLGLAHVPLLRSVFFETFHVSELPSVLLFYLQRMRKRPLTNLRFNDVFKCLHKMVSKSSICKNKHEGVYKMFDNK